MTLHISRIVLLTGEETKIFQSYSQECQCEPAGVRQLDGRISWWWQMSIPVTEERHLSGLLRPAGWLAEMFGIPSSSWSSLASSCNPGDATSDQRKSAKVIHYV